MSLTGRGAGGALNWCRLHGVQVILTGALLAALWVNLPLLKRWWQGMLPDRSPQVELTFKVEAPGPTDIENQQAPQPLVVTALGGSVGTGDTPVEAEVVAFASLDALKAAPEGSLEGKIAVITNRMVRFRDGRGYGPAVGARSQGAVEAARRGAVAVLIRSIGTSHDRFAHTGVMRYAEGVARGDWNDDPAQHAAGDAVHDDQPVAGVVVRVGEPA